MSSHFMHAARRRSLACALIAAATLTATAACAVGGTVSAQGETGNGAAAAGAPVVVDSSPSSLFDGILLGNALPKPALMLTDSNGKPYDLRKRTQGKLTLLYFGYTHCPDVCPTTMADLAATLRDLSPAQRAQIDVVFVTTDPNRDTAPVLKAWLGQFDPGFVGLTGSFGTIQKAAASVGISIDKPVPLPGGGYTVSHGAEVLAFNRTDDKAHLVFSGGETVPQYKHDMPLLLAGRDLHGQ